MATIKLNDIHKVMELMGEAYYYTTLPDLTGSNDILELADFEMPVSEDGVTFNVGDPDITRKKITAGINWISYAKRGDDEMTFQVPSFADKINELFMSKKGAEKTITFGKETYKGTGYSAAPKKVTGAWVFCNQAHTIVVILPNAEAYGTFKGASGDNEGYYNVSLTSLSNSDGADIIILHKTEAAPSPA